jgi:ComF family protein
MKTGLIKTIKGATRSRVDWLITHGRKLQAAGLDLLYPPHCLGCQKAISTSNGLCGACWGKLRFITKPICPILGTPFGADMGPNILSAEAIAKPPAFDRARSAVLYDQLARQLVSQFKYGDRLEIAKLLARHMVVAGAEFWHGDIVLVPVPLHWRRRLVRKYNQSQLLADEIAELTGARVANNWVKRVKPTKRQVGLSSKDREKNVRGAFELTPKFMEQYSGETIVIIDDVVTTGATVDAITRCFPKKNRTRVNVLSFARVVSDGQDAI